MTALKEVKFVVRTGFFSIPIDYKKMEQSPCGDILLQVCRLMPSVAEAAWGFPDDFVTGETDRVEITLDSDMTPEDAQAIATRVQTVVDCLLSLE